MNTTEYESCKELIWEIENNIHPDNAIEQLNELIADEAGYVYSTDDLRAYLYDPEGVEIDRESLPAPKRWLIEENCYFATNSDLCWQKLPLPDGYFFEVSQGFEESDDGEPLFVGYGAEIRFWDDSDPQFIKYWIGETESRLPSLAMLTAWINMRHDLYNREMR